MELKLPVKPNQVWKVGPHLVICGDLLDEPITNLVHHYRPEPDLVYTDMPWTSSHIIAYQGEAGTLVEGRDQFEEDLARLWDRGIAVSRSAANIYFEMGLPDCNYFIPHIMDAGGSILATCELTYRSGRHHCALLRASFQVAGVIASWTNGLPKGIDHELAPFAVITQNCQPGALILDPCCGKGITLLAAHKAGCYGVGVELVPDRAAQAIIHLVNAGAGEPQLVTPPALTEGRNTDA